MRREGDQDPALDGESLVRLALEVEELAGRLGSGLLASPPAPEFGRRRTRARLVPGEARGWRRVGRGSGAGQSEKRPRDRRFPALVLGLLETEHRVARRLRPVPLSLEVKQQFSALGEGSPDSLTSPRPPGFLLRRFSGSPEAPAAAPPSSYSLRHVERGNGAIRVGTTNRHGRPRGHARLDRALCRAPLARQAGRASGPRQAGQLSSILLAVGLAEYAGATSSAEGSSRRRPGAPAPPTGSAAISSSASPPRTRSRSSGWWRASRALPPPIRRFCSRFPPSPSLPRLPRGAPGRPRGTRRAADPGLPVAPFPRLLIKPASDNRCPGFECGRRPAFLFE